MRLDKYLKVSRLIKRRPIAKEMADKGRITINDQIAKSASQVKAGDEITVSFGHKKVTVRVSELRDSTKKADAKEMYELLSEEYLDRKEPEFF